MPTGKHLSQFGSAREAKEFLIAKIVDEAQRESVPLSDVEPKELYFSETAWALPDMASVNEAFDRDYDRRDYEKRIKQLVRSARTRARKEDPQTSRAWSAAIQTLS